MVLIELEGFCPVTLGLLQMEKHLFLVSVFVVNRCF